MKLVGIVAIALVEVACSASRSTPPVPTAAQSVGEDHNAPASAAAATGRESATEVPAARTGSNECGPRRDGRVCMARGIARFGRSATEARFEERPARGARLDAFAIDQNEVAASAYADCVERGVCRVARCDDGTAPPTIGPSRCVAWADAHTYCESVGGRLPFEAEWERAAAGLLPGHRAFPWGEDAGTPATGVPIAVIDSTPDGVRAMGGGVAEWVEDVGAFYQLPPRVDAGVDAEAAGTDATVLATAAPSVNESAEMETADAGTETFDSGLVTVDRPHGPRDGVWRVVRGGNDEIAIVQWTTTRRRFRIPTERRAWIGFRCAYSAQ